MVDFGTNHPDTRPLSELLTKKLRPGDIYTHVFSGLRNEQLANGKLRRARAVGRVDRLAEQIDPSLSGPLGIAQISGQTAHNAVRKGSLIERVASLCANLIFLAAVISVAVGIVNLLPLPILDGGQILYCAIEAVRRRPMERGVQEVAFFTGAAAVGLLFAFATWNDLQRLNVLEFLRGMLS